MFLYKLKLAIRSLAKDKLNSFINIFGLAVGMAAVILISLYVQHELSYDKYNEKHERIYNLVSQMGKESLNSSYRCCRIDPEIFPQELPGIGEVTQIYGGWELEVVNREKRFYNFTFLYADSNFPQVFDLDFIKGNPEMALIDIKSVIIDQSTAKSIFGDIDPLGQDLTIGDQEYSISGIIKDIPSNSHYQTNIIAPLKSLQDLEEYKGLEFNTYFLLEENVNHSTCLETARQKYNNVIGKFKTYGYKTNSYFQNLSKIHFNSNINNPVGVNGNYSAVLVFILIAILILIIAIINFINITTSQYEGKIVEIGTRKTLGASRTELIKQFLGKSITLSSLAILLAIILSEIFLPSFSQLIERKLVINYSNNLLLSIGLPLLGIVVGIVSGIYPAIYISKPQPTAILKGNYIGSKNWLTKFLVIFQFIVTFTLLSCLFLLNDQVKYLKNVDLGFNPENVISVEKLNEKLCKAYPSIKEELLKIPSVISVSATDHKPGNGTSGEGFSLVGQEKEKSKSFNSNRIQPDYFKTVGISIIQGKGFKDNGANFGNGILINEAGARHIGIENPVGIRVNFRGREQEIIGLVKDFNYESLHAKIQPLMFSHEEFGFDCILIRYMGNDQQLLIDNIAQILQKFDPGYIPNYDTLEEFFKAKYKKEENVFSLAAYGSSISIILALLGLYALTLFMVQKRTKEIGIRKVNGASEWQITSLLFSTFSKWLAIAFVIAVPISYFIMNNRLEQFAYRIEIGVLPFTIAGFVTVFFALLRVC
jgi:putative ABC transport system permease protein